MNTARAQTWFGALTPASSDAASTPSRPLPQYVAASGREPRCDLTFAPFGGPKLGRYVVVTSSRSAYQLAGPLSVSLEYLDDGSVFASHASLPVHGYGKTYLDALESFCEMFDSQYKDLVEAPKDALTPHACMEREKFERIVSLVNVKVI